MKATIMGKDGLRTVDLNRRKATREKCLNCSCWSPKEAIACKFKECPLRPFRSGEGRQKPKERQRAIRLYCLWCMVGRSSEVRKCPSLTCPLFPYRLKGTDHSVEVPSNLEKGHIQPLFEMEKTACGEMGSHYAR